MNKDFFDSFMKVWKETQGVITAATASKLLNVSRQNFNDIIKRKKIKKYKFNNKGSFFSLKDILYEKYTRRTKTNGKINHFTENPPSLPKEKDKILS